MAFVRVMCDSADHNKWFRGETASVDLMKHLIGNDVSEFSIYDVRTDIEEARAIAAQFLLLTSHQRFITMSALRIIESREITELEILIDQSHGETGIQEIDARHRNLIGNRDKFEMLFNRLYEALRRGEDRVRVIGKLQLAHQVREFVHLNGNAISHRAKIRCQRLLQANG